MRAIRTSSTGEAGTRAGGALAMALVAVMTVAVLGMSYVALTSSAAREEAGALDKKLAFYVAEAGLAEAWSGLTVGRSGNVGTEQEPAAFGEGFFFVVATDLSDDMVRLESTGCVGRGRAKLAIVVERGEASVVSLGMFSGEELAVPAGSRIDAWDSSQGAYGEDEGESTAVARLGSNSQVVLDGTEIAPTHVGGDVTAGPNQDVQLSPWVEVEGEATSAYAARELPPVQTPERAMKRGLRAGAATPVVLAPGESGLQSVLVESGGHLLIQGPAAHVLGSLQVDPGGELVIDTTNGRVDLWVQSKLQLAQGSSLSTTSSDPSQVLVQVESSADQPVVLGALSSFHGVVYAPQAEVQLAPSFEVFGGVSGRRLSFSGPARLHFDANLLAVAAQLALPRMVSWRLLTVDAEPGGGLDADPFHRFGLDRAALPTPSAAHADQHLHLSYLDASLTPKTYDGPESGFDWTQVERVLEGSRDGTTLRVPGKDALGAARGDESAQSVGTDELGDALRDPGKSSAELRDELLAAAPVRPGVLAQALMRTPHLDSADMASVLFAHFPLDPAVGAIAVGTPNALSDADLEALLLAASPLPAGVLDALLARDPPLDSTALSNVMAAQ